MQDLLLRMLLLELRIVKIRSKSKMSESIQESLRVDELPESNPHTGEHQTDVNSGGQNLGSLETDKNVSPAEQSARYFQSEKDKLYAENQELKKYETIGKYLERNPQVAYGLADQIKNGGQPQQRPPQQQAPGQPPRKAPPRMKPPEDFDPYEAYTNPSSESYKFRMKEQAAMADYISSQRVGQAYNTAMQQQAMGNLVSELKTKFNYDDGKIAEFVKFASTPADQLGLEKVVQMFETVSPQEMAPPDNNLEQVRATQQAPPSTGILQGERPAQPSPVDAVWRGVMGANNKGTISQMIKK
jgi:hypothetical protein